MRIYYALFYLLANSVLVCFLTLYCALSIFFFFLMIRRPPRSTLSSSSAASDVYKRQGICNKMNKSTICLGDDHISARGLVFRDAVRTRRPPFVVGLATTGTARVVVGAAVCGRCLLYTSPSPRDS
eukprot:TRINITY_DN46671_c0_g1_i1.p1 TRINITY_DN46671_c0_g1~~TRINITY_DN46671_c0_g1_i1.p1  ORF type:complete len:126 (-),score=15.80 TRINITY_DN46671_c0_g1_i1:132-509(-)